MDKVGWNSTRGGRWALLQENDYFGAMRFDLSELGGLRGMEMGTGNGNAELAGDGWAALLTMETGSRTFRIASGILLASESSQSRIS